MLQLGVIEDGGWKGRKIILSPRVHLKQNEYLVEKGVFFNGAPEFSKACLACLEFIPNEGCEKDHS